MLTKVFQFVIQYKQKFSDYRLLFLRPEFAIWWQNNPKLLVNLRSLYGQEIGNRRFADSSLDEVFVVTRTTLDQVLSTIWINYLLLMGKPE